MKKIVFLICILFLCISVYISDTNDTLGIKHKISNKHEPVHMINDSMMSVHDTLINITHWIVPHGDSIDIHISEDSIDLSTMIPTDGGILISARKALVLLGKCLYFDRTLTRKSTCADCHDMQASGTGFTNKSQGGGMEYQHRNNLYTWWTGHQSFVELDKKPFKNFSVLNAFRLHQFGSILSAVFHSDYPLEFQVTKAMEAHFVSDAVLQCQQVPLYNRISHRIFNRKLDESIYKMAISAFEQTLTTYDNNINKIARGESKTLYYADAFVSLNSDCAGCHQTHSVSQSKAINPIHKTTKATGLDLNNAYHQGYMHTSDDISFNRAIYACATAEGYNVTMKQATTTAATIRQNLTDPNYR